jgi:hypothetical protein
MKTALPVVVALAMALGTVAAPATPRIVEHVPDTPDPDARYLFYLHGRIIEVQGPKAVSPDFGRYEYQQILEAFADRGFVVVAEVREDGAGRQCAVATARQVRHLLDAGVPARNVTVVGFSKGGFLALGVSAEVASEEVGYAILAGCGSDLISRLGPRIRGRFLSLLDASDRFSPSCEPLFAAAEQVREKDQHVFETGLDHGLFYEPRPEWVDRVVDWARPATGGE